MFGNYSPANLNRQSSAGKNKAGKYPDRHFTTGKHKTGKAKTGNRIFPFDNRGPTDVQKTSKINTFWTS